MKTKERKQKVRETAREIRGGRRRDQGCGGNEPPSQGRLGSEERRGRGRGRERERERWRKRGRKEWEVREEDTMRGMILMQ